jgi:hypothetical protein
MLRLAFTRYVAAAMLLPDRPPLACKLRTSDSRMPDAKGQRIALRVGRHGGFCHGSHNPECESGLGGLAAFLRGLRFRNRPEFGWSVGLLHELA